MSFSSKGVIMHEFGNVALHFRYSRNLSEYNRYIKYIYFKVAELLALGPRLKISVI